MPSAMPDLRKAIRDTLAANAALTALLGGAKIHDEVPPGAAFPYVVLGDAETRPFGTQTSDGEEHRLSLSAWSMQGGRREAHLIAAALLDALADAPLSLPDHALIHMRLASADIARQPDGRTHAAHLRFRAITEPL
jgi:hypothetical protein